jgi:ABC-type multidrug transport system ATPase subunit
LIQIGSPKELKRKVSELSVIEVETPGLSNEKIEKIRALGEVCSVKYADPVLQIRCSQDDGLAEKVVKVLLSEGSRVKSISTKEPTLEEAFITLTGGEEEVDRFLEKSTRKK